MHALVVTVDPGSRSAEEGRRTLENEVVPRVKQNKGFLVGYWLAPKDGHALSVTFYETADDAEAAHARIQVTQGVRLVSADVRQVSASVQGAAAGQS